MPDPEGTGATGDGHPAPGPEPGRAGGSPRPARVRPGRRPGTGAVLAVALSAAVVMLAAGCTDRSADEPQSGAVPTGAPSSDRPFTDASTPSSPAPTSGRSGTTAPTNLSPAITLRTVDLAPGVNDEASGITESGTAPGLFFLVDDSTGTNALAVVDGQGDLVTRVELTGMSAANAEALTAGPCGAAVPRPDGGTDGLCLYVGDIGDNAETRPDIAIYRTTEPDLSGVVPGADHLIVATDEWRYTYPDRPQNAESMLIASDGSIIVVTKPKNGAPHRMYRGAPGGGTLEFVREFEMPGSPRPMRTILTGNVATDAAATPGRVLLLTYDDVHEYTAPDPSADLAGFPDWPNRSLPFPQLPQAEGIAGAADGCGYVIASEAGPGGKAGSLGIATCS